MNIKDYANSGILEIKEYIPGKSIKHVERELNLSEIYKMASNENPNGASPRAKEAYRSLGDHLHKYPEIYNPELMAKFAQKLNLKPENITTGNGGDGVIYNFGMAFINDGDEAIIPEITFPVYETITKIMRGIPVFTKMKGTLIDLDDIYKKITSKTKVIYICNPNNPTGEAMPVKELTQFMQNIPEKTILFLDEAYIEFTEEKYNPNALEMIRKGVKNLFILRTFSKIYGLAGVRIGYGISNPEFIKLVQLVKPPFDVSLIAENLAISALDDADFFNKTLDETNIEKKYYYSELDKMGLKYYKSQTNYILIDTGIDGVSVTEKLLKKGIIVRSAKSYNFPSCIRVTIGRKKENELFFKYFKEILGK
ncbi:MAG: histidinol-phosphate transaminase [Spirochaetes bacterium]|nr:histidinol-phosphate transaminase [Spirochaetota bacterium]